jgi:4-diphosphocytidyl-2C-methyl-D-erythritol kinase
MTLTLLEMQTWAIENVDEVDFQFSLLNSWTVQQPPKVSVLKHKATNLFFRAEDLSMKKFGWTKKPQLRVKKILTSSFFKQRKGQ